MLIPRNLHKVGTFVGEDDASIFIQNPNNAITGDLRVEVITILGYLASRAFGRCVDLDEIESVALMNAKSLYISTSNNQIVGFASVNDEPSEISVAQHLHGIAVAPDAVGLKIGEGLIKIVLETTALKYLSTVTQNPVLYNLLLKLGASVYPTTTREAIPEAIGKIALLSKQGKEGKISAQNLVFPGTYLYIDRFRWSSNEAVNNLFRDLLDFEDDYTPNKFYLVAKF
jgi:hypothetical protein